METALLAFGLYCLTDRTDGYTLNGPVKSNTPREPPDDKKNL